MIDEALATKRVLRKIQPVQVQGLLIDQKFFVPTPSELGDLNDPANQRSLVNCLNERLKIRLRELSVAGKMFPDERTVRHEAGNDIRRLIKLKYAFFENYCYAADAKKKISVDSVTSGICTFEFWHKVEKNDLFCAFVMSPPTPWHVQAQDMLHELFYRIRLLLDRRLADKRGLDISAVRAFRELAACLTELQAQPVRYNLAVISRDSKNRYSKTKTKRTLNDTLTDDHQTINEIPADDRSADEIEAELDAIERGEAPVVREEEDFVDSTLSK